MPGPRTETKLAPPQTDSKIRLEPRLSTRVGPSTKKAWDRGGFRGGFRGGSRSGTGGGRGGGGAEIFFPLFLIKYFQAEPLWAS